MDAILCPICGETSVKDNGEFFSCTTCGAKINTLRMKNIQDQLDSLLQKNKEIDLGNLRYSVNQELKNPKWNIDRIKSLCQEILTFYPEDYISNFLLAFIDKKGKLRDNYHHYLKVLSESDVQEYELKVIIPICIRYCENRDKEYVEGLLRAKGKYDLYKNDLKEALETRKKEIDLFNPEIEREVFICHSSEDIEVVKDIDKALKKESFDTWYSEKNSPQDNVNYWNDIDSAIEHCKIFLIVLSSSMLESRDCLRELKHAYNQDRIILEYRIDNSTNSRGIKQYFEGQWIDGSSHSNIDKLVEVIFEKVNEKDDKKKKKKEEVKVEQKEVIQEEDKGGINLSKIKIDLSPKEEENTDLYKDIFKLDQQSKSHSIAFDEAKYQYSQGHYSKAIAIVAPINSNYAHFLHARCLEALGEYKRAREQLGRINSTYPLYYYYCGQLYEKGSYNRGSRESIAYYKRSASGGFVIAKRELGRVYLEQKDYVNAKTFFEDAALQEDIESKFELVKLYGDQKEIKPDYNRAYSLLMECVNASYEPAVEYLIHALQYGNDYIRKDPFKARELARQAGPKYRSKNSYNSHFFNLKFFIPNLLATIALVVLHILLNYDIIPGNYELAAWIISIIGMVLILESPLSRLSGYFLSTSQLLIASFVLLTQTRGKDPYIVLELFTVSALTVMIIKDYVKTKVYTQPKENVLMALTIVSQLATFSAYSILGQTNAIGGALFFSIFAFLVTLSSSNTIKSSTKRDKYITLILMLSLSATMIVAYICSVNQDDALFSVIIGIGLTLFADSMFLLSTNKPTQTMNMK